MTLREDLSDRLRAGLPTLIVHLLIGLALLRGLGGDLPEPPAAVPTLVALAPPQQPIVNAQPNRRERSRRREGAASPPNLESRRTELVAPPSPLPPPPQTLVTAPTPGPGLDRTAGASHLPGPGTGSGGLGNGTGSGRFGDGPGGGGDGDGGGGSASPPRQIRGTIRSRDYPPGLGEAGIDGAVSVIYTVEPDGRATGCRITASSGSAELDSHTCRLIEQRFRFRPSLDGRGRPVRSRIVQDHYWEVQDEPARPREPPRRRRFSPF